MGHHHLDMMSCKSNLRRTGRKRCILAVGYREYHTNNMTAAVARYPESCRHQSRSPIPQRRPPPPRVLLSSCFAN